MPAPAIARDQTDSRDGAYWLLEGSRFEQLDGGGWPMDHEETGVELLLREPEILAWLGLDENRVTDDELASGAKRNRGRTRSGDAEHRRSS